MHTRLQGRMTPTASCKPLMTYTFSHSNPFYPTTASNLCEFHSHFPPTSPSLYILLFTGNRRSPHYKFILMVHVLSTAIISGIMTRCNQLTTTESNGGTSRPHYANRNRCWPVLKMKTIVFYSKDLNFNAALCNFYLNKHDFFHVSDTLCFIYLV